MQDFESELGIQELHWRTHHRNMLSSIASTRFEGEVQSVVRVDAVVSVAELVSSEAVDTAGLPVADV